MLQRWDGSSSLPAQNNWKKKLEILKPPSQKTVASLLKGNGNKYLILRLHDKDKDAGRDNKTLPKQFKNQFSTFRHYSLVRRFSSKAQIDLWSTTGKPAALYGWNYYASFHTLFFLPVFICINNPLLIHNIAPRRKIFTDFSGEFIMTSFISVWLILFVTGSSMLQCFCNGYVNSLVTYLTPMLWKE